METIYTSCFLQVYRFLQSTMAPILFLVSPFFLFPFAFFFNTEG